MSDFDAYLMVDWSASSRPATGADSIWYCLMTRDHTCLSVRVLENPPTRSRAVREIEGTLREMVRRGTRVLVGFDFPYGYPSGFASALGLKDTPPWLAVWREIAGKIVDRNDNRNNRFETAADLNQRFSGGCYPFWGCPRSSECSTLSATKGGPGRLADKRITDVGNMQPIWKLYGNGSVGSQTLLGVPHLAALRNDPLLAPVSTLWPFETGLRPLSSGQTRNWLILHAEIYPSLLRLQPGPGEIKDAVQVRGLAAHFAALDEAAQLGHLFAGPPSLTAAQREIVEREEGWTLGVVARSEPQARPQSGPQPPSLPSAATNVTARQHRGEASRTTEAGYENRNHQVVIGCTRLAGTDHGQYVYVLRCGTCGHEYGANGSDIFQRHCPLCQGGRPGSQY
jgi:precorrin-8X/cobalt-precorrin-8 methylmutase